MLQLPHGFQISAGNTAVAALLARPDTHILLFAGQKLIQRSEGPPALTRHDYGTLLDGAAWHACEPLGTWQGNPWLAIGLDALPSTGAFPASGTTSSSHATPGISASAIGTPAVGTLTSGTHATGAPLPPAGKPPACAAGSAACPTGWPPLPCRPASCSNGSVPTAGAVPAVCRRNG